MVNYRVRVVVGADEVVVNDRERGEEDMVGGTRAAMEGLGVLGL